MAGEVIGVGIFLTPAQMIRTLGSPFWLLVVWLVMALMALTGALCYGALAAQHPEAGGGYVYLRERWGRAVAFLYGWKCLFVLDPGLTAALAVGVASYAGHLVELSPAAQKLTAILAILGVAATNLLGVRQGAGLTRWLTLLKLGLLGFIILWGMLGGLGSWEHFSPFVAQRPGAAALGPALAAGFVAAFFSFGGWWDAAKVAGETRDPTRTVPRALILGVLLVAIVYILTTAAFLYLVPFEQVGSGETFAAQAGQALFGANGGRVFAAAVIVAVLSSLASYMTAAPRVYFAMAGDGLLFRWAAALHPRFGSPVAAILIQAALACVLVTIGSFDQIVGYFLFVTVLFVALAGAGVLRRTPEGATRPAAAVPLVFLLLSALLLILFVVDSPTQVLLGCAVSALGLPVYHFAFRSRGREPV